MTGFARIDDPQPMAHLEMLDMECATQAIYLPCDTEAIAKSSMGDGKSMSKETWFFGKSLIFAGAENR
jgi:hypothetical protein